MRQAAAKNEMENALTLGWLTYGLLAGGAAHTLACWLMLQLDFFRGSATVFLVLFTFIWLGHLALLLLGSFRRQLRISSELVVGLVLVWSTLVVLASAFFIDQMRLGVMVFFFAIVQTGVFRASRRLLIGIGLLAVLGYGVILLWVHLWYAVAISWQAELNQWLAFSLVTGWAMALALDINELKALLHLRNGQLEDVAKRIIGIAMHDDLTGLYNRRHAMGRLGKLRELALRNGLSLQLAYLDLDHFKQLNDRYGHAFGDEVLTHFADLLRQCASGRDFAARIGGEEFLLVLMETDAASAARQMQAFCRLCGEQRFAEQPDARLTVSIGLSEFDGKQTLAGWLAAADAALYCAKQEGRDRVVAADRGRHE